MAPVRRQTYRKADRLTHDLEFDRVFASRLKKVAGPLVIFAAPREGRTRLGLSVGTKVGNAVARNTVKRRLREAFRRCKDHLPAGLDLVVNVRPHKPLIAMADCQRLLLELCGSIDREQQRRARREATRPDETSPGAGR
jgi:ribonuclease P protein component